MYLFFHFHEHRKDWKKYKHCSIECMFMFTRYVDISLLFLIDIFYKTEVSSDLELVFISQVHWNVDMTVQGVGKLCLMLKIERIWHYFNVQHPYVFWYTTYFGNIFPNNIFIQNQINELQPLMISLALGWW